MLVQRLTSSVSGDRDLFLIYTLYQVYSSKLVDHNCRKMRLDAIRSNSYVSKGFYHSIWKSPKLCRYNHSRPKCSNAYPTTTKKFGNSSSGPKTTEKWFTTPQRRENRDRERWNQKILKKVAFRAKQGRSGQISWNELCTSSPAGVWTVPPSAASLPPRPGV